MRILLLSHFPLFGNGSGNYTRKLAGQLVKEGHEVAILAPGEHEVPSVRVFPLKITYRAVFFSHPDWKNAPRYSDLTPAQITRQYHGFLDSVIGTVEVFKPDLLHVNHCFMLSWVANYVRSMFGIGYVVTAHGTGILQSTSDRRYYALTRQALEKASGLLPVSTHTRKWLLRAFGRKLVYKTRIITPGISNDILTRPPSVGAIERKYHLAGKNIVLFVGRLTPEKGVEYLIKAANRIKGEIYIIGGGSHKRSLEELAKRLGVKNVHFLGYFGQEYLAELWQFYARANVLVLPSVVDEAMPLVILEAMAAKTAIVASRKGGIPLAIKHGETGLLVRARSVSALAEAINKVLADPLLQRRLGEAAYRLVKSRFTWPSITPSVLRVYDWALATTKALRRRRGYFDQATLERERLELRSR